jgi:type II secretory pathway component PulK
VILDARARLNLNRASRRDLERLLAALAVPAGDARRVLDAVGTGPLDRVEQLRSHAGISPAAYARLAPHVTVVGDDRVNVNSASVPVLLTVPGVDSDAATLIVGRRRVAPYRNVFELIGSLPSHSQARMQTRIAELVDRVAFTPRVVEIVVSAVARDPGVQAEVVATVHLAGGQNRSILRTAER